MFYPLCIYITYILRICILSLHILLINLNT